MSSTVLVFFAVDGRRAMGLTAVAAAVVPDDLRVAGMTPHKFSGFLYRLLVELMLSQDLNDIDLIQWW